MKINDVIHQRRQALGLTQEGLADRLGVSAPAVNKWERLLSSLAVPWDPSWSPLYAHLVSEKAAKGCREALIQPVLVQVERDPACASLQAEPGWGELRRRYLKN